jgi:protein-arginine kinase
MTEYPEIPEDATSQLAKHLTRERWEALREARSEPGWTLEDLCRSGLENPDSSVGLYVGDANCFEAFAPLLDAVLAELGQGAVDVPPATPGDLGAEVVSTRVRAARNLAGHRFPAAQSREEREQLLDAVEGALAALPEPWRGTFHRLDGLDEDTQRDLVDAHLLFHDDDRFMRSAGFFRDWPAGRGVFLSEDRCFSVWIGEEDHLRVTSLQKGGDLGAVWGRVSGALERLDEALGFATHPRHGVLASCPSNVGTGVRASVHLPLPRLAADEPGLKERADGLGLQLRGTGGEHTEARGSVYDCSIRVRVGVPAEVQLAGLARGVAALREAEGAQ